MEVVGGKVVESKADSKQPHYELLAPVSFAQRFPLWT